MQIYYVNNYSKQVLALKKISSTSNQLDKFVFLSQTFVVLINVHT